ncbi:actin interacting protein 3-domain-containing protein [Cantharellus anzutake]|uniref:actin interacting protein 3-domain-containing protein n=1 Tax=Cantharellus anzutake TaxID=1750568 RepID=UPI001903E14B|nr:actin interacting protein 3-domain-containing protein [Cantharellus anzutake]KAF8325873.1 actin interacting protein 3-domain-containing protein [Cantharellus anzutake]
MSVRGPRSSHGGPPSHHRQQSSSSISYSHGSSPAVESAVTRLLMAIKQLLEALQLWSVGKVTDQQVSDKYVQLGNDFNATVAAFASVRIDMSEFLPFPDDLRHVLEAALAADEPGPAVLEVYLPRVRAIITSLLHGLRDKQTILKKHFADRQERKARAEAMGLTSSRSDRPSHSSTSRKDRYASSSRPSSRGPSEVGSDYPRNESISRSSRHPETSELPPLPNRDSSLSHPDVSSGDPVPGAYPAPSLQHTQITNEAQGVPVNDDSKHDENPESSLPLQPQTTGTSPPPRSSTPVQRADRSGKHPLGRSHARVSRTADEERPPSRRSLEHTRPELPPKRTPPPSEPPTLPPIEANPEPLMSSAPSPGPIPSHIKRYSLSDNPVPQLPAISVEGSSPALDDVEVEEKGPPTHPASETSLAEVMSTPAAEEPLAALKKNEHLARRASKRFSEYTFSKFVGSGQNDRSNRKSMLAASSLLSPSDLNAVAEDDTTPVPSPSKPRRNELTRKKSLEAMRRTFQPVTEEEEPPLPPVPAMAREPVPSNSMRAGVPTMPSTIPQVPPEGSEATSPTLTNGTIDATTEPKHPTLSTLQTSDGVQTLTVFLQVGKQVKKTTVETSGLSCASLRVLFVDKFQYNPGTSDFPSIYIRDPSSGVQYELEDVEEVHDRSLLSLNIEPLDQIKQHIDVQMSALSQELRDLKTTVAATRRQSIQVSPALLQTISPAATPERPSEKRFRDAAKRLTRVMAKEDFMKFAEFASGPLPNSPQSPLPSPLAPQMTGGSTISDERAARMVSDLKVQFDEIQNLRRDLGVMRQIYTEFMGSTKDALVQLRGQAQSLREVATAKVGGSRAYIDSGKSKLDTRSQDLLTKVDELQDTVEALRDDVLKRHVQPKPNAMQTLKANIETTAVELERLREHIALVKPSWKQTWEEELQNIVEEQQFLNHQEEFVKDLIEDHKALKEVNDQLAQVLSLRTTKGSRNGPKFNPLPVEEGHEGLSTVMLEIRGAQVDPEKRMKAIEANQKARQRELADRSDEFQDELSSFVSGKKLKMTGGAEEAERVRQKRNEMTLKAMFQPSDP